MTARAAESERARVQQVPRKKLLFGARFQLRAREQARERAFIRILRLIISDAAPFNLSSARLTPMSGAQL